MIELEARIHENQIVVPIGTAISFKMIAKNQQKIDLKVTESEETSKFFVLFDENDVDFEIEINNTKCIHGIGYTLIVNNGFYDYYIGGGERWLMEALYTRGRKLHFTSEYSEDGQNVIKQTAQEYDISYSESAALCSRIEFNFEVEKIESKPLPRLEGQTPKPQNRSKSFLPSFGSWSSARSMSLGRDVTDNSIANNYSAAESKLDRASEISSSQHLFGQRSGVLPNVSTLASKWHPGQEGQKQVNKNEPQIGDKGVVCFGEQSNQFYNTYNGFTKDKNLEIKPFVVELRFAKK